MSQKKTTTQTLQADPEIRSRGLQLFDQAQGTLPGARLNDLQVQALQGYQGFSDPTSYFTGNIGQFMNPYTSDVVDASMGDLDRARQLANRDARSMATQQGAFGGDRAALLEAENNRNFLDAAARSSAQLRSAGFDQASRNLYNYGNMGLSALGGIGGYGNMLQQMPYQRLGALGGLLGNIQGNRTMTDTQQGSFWGGLTGLAGIGLGGWLGNR